MHNVSKPSRKRIRNSYSLVSPQLPSTEVTNNTSTPVPARSSHTILSHTSSPIRINPNKDRTPISYSPFPSEEFQSAPEVAPANDLCNEAPLPKRRRVEETPEPFKTPRKPLLIPKISRKRVMLEFKEPDPATFTSLTELFDYGDIITRNPEIVNFHNCLVILLRALRKYLLYYVM